MSSSRSWKRESDADRAAVVSLRTGERRILAENAAYPRYLPTGHLVFTRPGALLAVPFSLKRLEASGSPVPVLDDLVTNRVFANASPRSPSRTKGRLSTLPDGQLQRTLGLGGPERRGGTVPFPRRRLQGGGPFAGRRAHCSDCRSRKARQMALLIGDTRPGDTQPFAGRGTFPRSGVDAGRETDCLRLCAQDGALTWKVFIGRAPTRASRPSASMEQTGTLTRDPVLFHPTVTLCFSTWQTSATHAAVLDTNGTSTFSRSAGRGRRVPSSRQSSWKEPLVFTRRPMGRVLQSNESGHWEVFVRPFPGPGPRWQISTDGG